MCRPVTDPMSYRFQANIHGTYTPRPTRRRCRAGTSASGSFYFLSWHRMYLYFFDRILRAAAQDPNLVLPYWNWGDPAQRTLPLPFRQPANATNSLYIPCSGGPRALDNGTYSLSSATVDDSGAMSDVDFETALPRQRLRRRRRLRRCNSMARPVTWKCNPTNVVHSALGGLMGEPRHGEPDLLAAPRQHRPAVEPMDLAGRRPRRPDRRRLAEHHLHLLRRGRTRGLSDRCRDHRHDAPTQLPLRRRPPPPMFLQFPIILAENTAARGEERIRLEASPVTVRLPLDDPRLGAAGSASH